MSGYAQMGRLLTEAPTMEDLVQRGIAFASGRAGRVDYVEAHKWANVASANGSEAAAERRDVLANLMTAEQVAEAQARAKKFLSEQGK